MMPVKYSIIIPVYNGIQYLPTCIKTVIDQNYDSYELIVSDDHSTDGSDHYIASLNHPNIKGYSTSQKMSMAEHWEWALSKASGEWRIFVGQDDGLQPYFFEHADRLTKIADRKKINAIMSSRAYFFWPGCESVYGDINVSYGAADYCEIKRTKHEAIKTLFGYQNYFELPEMYTTSLFRRDLIVEAQCRQNGKLFTTHPQDANLAAIICHLEKRFLYSHIPLGWVGTSPKSAGLAITLANTDDQSLLKRTYLEKTVNSRIKTYKKIGDFSLGSTELYFWGALRKTRSLGRGYFSAVLTLKLFTAIVLAVAYQELEPFFHDGDKIKRSQFNGVMDNFGIRDLGTIRTISARMRSIRRFHTSCKRIFSRVRRMIVFEKDRTGSSFRSTWLSEPTMTLPKAQEISRAIYIAIKDKDHRHAKNSC